MSTLKQFWRQLQRLGWVAVIVVCLSITACGSDSEDGSNPMTVAPPVTPPPVEAGVISIPMPVRPVGSLKLLGLPVTVAGGTSELLLDSGSGGIRVLASTAGTSGLVRTDEPSTVEFADGTQFLGVIGFAPVALSTAATTEPIGVQIIDEVGCVFGASNCSDELFDGTGFFSGIVGVALANRSREAAIFSPVPQLAGNFSTGYIVQTGGFFSTSGFFTLGLTPTNTAGFAIRQLPQIGFFPNGSPIWQDEALEVRYTIANSTVQNDLGTTAFDTGSSDISLDVGALGSPPLPLTLVTSNGALRAGSQFEAILDGGFIFNVTVGPTGATPSRDRIFTDSFLGFQLVGMPFFFETDVLFDAELGRLGFRANGT